MSKNDQRYQDLVTDLQNLINRLKVKETVTVKVRGQQGRRQRDENGGATEASEGVMHSKVLSRELGESMTMV